MKLQLCKTSVDEMTVQMMPNLYKLDELTKEECEYDADGYFVYPPLVGLNFESISQIDGIYLLDDGFKLYLFIGAYTQV